MDIFEYINKNNESDLKSFASKSLGKEETLYTNKENARDQENLKKELSNKLDPNTIKQASDLYEKYKNYSTEDLEKQFISESKTRLKSGELSIDKLKGTIETITPMLNEKQKNILNNLLGKLNE